MPRRPASGPINEFGGGWDIDQQHLGRHVRELRERVAFLRPLRPGNASYKLWLGDIVELVSTVWGGDSPQMARITDVLRPDSAAPASGSEERRYLERLSRLETVLAGFEHSTVL